MFPKSSVHGIPPSRGFGSGNKPLGVRGVLCGMHVHTAYFPWGFMDYVIIAVSAKSNNFAPHIVGATYDTSL